MTLGPDDVAAGVAVGATVAAGAVVPAAAGAVSVFPPPHAVNPNRTNVVMPIVATFFIFLKSPLYPLRMIIILIKL
ncbi:hypothetical protein D3C86_2018960 [compost metagenome]